MVAVSGMAALVFLLVGYLMVSTWRFYSFKELNFGKPQNFRWIIVLGA